MMNTDDEGEPRVDLELEVSAEPPDVRVNLRGTISPWLARKISELVLSEVRILEAKVAEIDPAIRSETAVRMLDWTTRILRAAAEAEQQSTVVS